MDNRRGRNLSATLTTLLCAVLLLLTAVGEVQAQSGGSGYQLKPMPDVWYNDIDGIRLGGRLRGRMPGTFEDGPHRLDVGIWVGTWWPEHPLSYHFKYVEPIPSISGFSSEGSVQFMSSIRTGWHDHAVGFSKRWQQGFNEQEFTQVDLFLRGQKRFDDSYVLYPQLWQDKWLSLVDVDFMRRGTNTAGSYQLQLQLNYNLPLDAPSFVVSKLELMQRWEMGSGFFLDTRLFGGIASDETATEYRFMTAMPSAASWMQSGFTRAKGTIPVNWMQTGRFQLAGGANLRGYNRLLVDQLKQGITPGYTSITSANIQLEYPNPVNHLFGKLPVVGGLLKLESYTFFDVGTSTGLTADELDRTLADAGLGFMLSLNIPDYLGNPRGFMLRYELPLWLSEPGAVQQNENPFALRHLVGIGAVIPL